MLRLCLAGLLVMAVATAHGSEQGKEPEAGKGAKGVAVAPAGKEMTLTGTVEKMERKKKDGTVFMTWFQLSGDDGVVTRLPKEKAAEYVGMKVRIVGIGEETRKKDKTARRIEAIQSIEKVGEAAPAK